MACVTTWTSNKHDPESVLGYSHAYGILSKKNQEVSMVLNVALRIDVQKWDQHGAVYSPRECKHIYVGNLNTLRKRLARLLGLPYHSKEFSDDVAQLHSDMQQVLNYGLS